MNKSFKSVWNAKTRTFVAAAETARSQGKKSSSRVALAAAVAVAGFGSLMGASPAWAGGGLQLCGQTADSTKGTSFGAASAITPTGAAAGTAPMSGGSQLNCSAGGTYGNYGFSLNNMGADTGGSGFGMSTARVTGYDSGLLELKGTGGISMLGVVNMNNNKITGLGAGTISSTSTDAVNGAQLLNATRYFKAGGLADGTDDASAGTNSVAIGAGAVATSPGGTTIVTNGNVAIGAASSTGGGWGQIALGAGAKVTNTNSASIAIGRLSASSAGRSVALGDQTEATATSAVAVGGFAKATATNSLALGDYAAASAVNSVALGAGSTTTANLGAAGYNPGSDTLQGTASATNGEVSVGSAGKERRVTNVAAGSAGTDAVNVSQLQSLATKSGTTASTLAAALGGGAAVAADGTVSAPSYTVAGASRSNVGAALSALDGATVQFNGAGGAADVKGRKIVNLIDGTLSAASTEAVNGSQLFATNERVSAAEGSIGTIQGNISTINTNVAGLDTRVTTTEGDISTIKTNVGAIQGDVTNLDNRVTNVAGSVTSLTQQLNSGDVGLVKQDAGTLGITVAADKGGDAVSFANVNGDARTLSGVKAGALNATSTEAVNGSQLFATNERVSTAESSIGTIQGDISTINTTVGAIQGDVTNLDNRVTNVAGSVTNLTQQLNSGDVGLVKQDADTLAITVAADKGGASINIAGTDGARTLSGVKAGALNAASTEAVNGSQLFATNERVSAAEGSIGTIQTDISTINTNVAGLDTRVTTTEGDIRTINTNVGAIQTDISTINTNVAGLDTRVTANEGDISTIKTNVGAIQGDISTINTTVGAIQGDVTNLGDRVTNVAGSVTNLTQQLNSGDVGLVKQDAGTLAITVAADKGGDAVSFANVNGDARTLSGVKAGALNATSTEAVNGSQLFATNERVSAAEGSIGTIQGDISTINTNVASLDTRVTTNEGDIRTINTNVGAIQTDISTINTTVGTIQGDVTNLGDRVTNVAGSVTTLTQQLNSGDVGLVKQDAGTLGITVAADKGGDAVSFANVNGDARTLSGVKAGALNAASTEAVNGSQLFATNDRVSAAEGSIGTIQGDISTINTNVAGLDTRVTTNEGDIRTINTNVGAIQTDISTINSNVAGLDTRVTTTEGDIRTINTNVGTIQNDITTINTTVGAIQGDVTNLGDRVTNVAGSVTNLTQQMNAGDVGLVKQDADTLAITVAADKGGASMNIAGTNGPRTLSGVAAGRSETDAVNVGQLKQAGVVDSNGQAREVLAYDVGTSKGTITLGGAQGTQLKNVADGTDNNDAVNLGQLKKSGVVDGSGNTRDVVTYDASSNRGKVTFGDVGAPPVLLSNVAAGRVDTDAANVGQLRSVVSALGGDAAIGSDGRVVAPTYTVNDQSYSNVNDALQGLAGRIDKSATVVEKVTSTDQAGGQLATSGDGSQKAVAGGSNAVAVGPDANASANNSVALGAGSTTGSRDNTVSVGSAGNERAITNVADGVMETDAVNKRQLDSVADSNRAYTDQRINQVQSEIASVKRDANAAAASSMAVAALPQSVIPGRGMASAAVSNMSGESAMAVGVSKVAENGRWVTKLSGTVNTRGNAGVSAGIGFHW